MGGAIFVSNSTRWGGVLHSYSSTITIEESEFHNNARTWGEVLYSDSSTITIKVSEFYDNSANHGGVLVQDYSYQSTITIIEESKFHDNYATTNGGVLYSSYGSTIIKASELMPSMMEEYCIPPPAVLLQ